MPRSIDPPITHRAIPGVERKPVHETAGAPRTREIIEFASPQAAQLARGVDRALFRGQQPSGDKGFTVADVKRISGK